jgi:hypothetical protein
MRNTLREMSPQRLGQVPWRCEAHMKLLKQRCALNLQGEQTAAQDFDKVNHSEDDVTVCSAHCLLQSDRSASRTARGPTLNQDADADDSQNSSEEPPEKKQEDVMKAAAPHGENQAGKMASTEIKIGVWE